MARVTACGTSDFLKNYFGKLKFVLKAVGISFSGDESGIYKVYSFLLIFLVSFLYMLLDTIEIFKHDMDVVSNMIMYPFAIILGFAKTIVFLRNRIKFGKLLNKLEQDPFLPNIERGGETEEKLIKECVWMTKAQTLLYWIIASITVVIGTSISLFKRIRSSDYHNWEMPYGPFTVVNTTYSPNYELTWFYQNLCIYIVTIQFTTYDLIMAAILAHISYQFKMLQNNIRRIVHLSFEDMRKETGRLNNSLSRENSSALDESDTSTIPWKYLNKHLGQAVNYHVEIINIAKEMETSLNGLLLFVFLNTLGINCFLVYHASMGSLNDARMLVTVGAALVACGQVLAICYWGEQVVNESQEVGKAAVEANFVGTDVRFQKSLSLIILRSQSPTALTAGKFSVICLSTFAWMLRTSYSAFMMLRNMNQ